ncbi:nuclear transport factor 2 family protein [Herbaspirillum sp. LeCh32-8]|uniref:YybH family protein n=1 Tax=Herbaspirillum sp. LeCh32-8 TaxID=2821356 RepID=UPI001FD757AE|nr:nuclear transport factor 2 family protein [Herbaspirillum sp. LeCh32-8]
MSDINKLMRAGQYAEALNKTDAILAKHPRDAQLRFTKGLILAEQNRSAEAIAVFTKLTEDFPDLPEPYNNLAVLYASEGQYDKARASLDMAMRTNPTYATALENLGDVYAKLASQAYDKALQIDPANNVPQPKLTLLRSLNGNASGGTVPRLASAAAGQAAQRDAKAKADAAAAEQQERTRALAAEKATQQAAADKAAAEKAAIAKASADKAAADKAAADKAAADKTAQEKAAADRAASDKAAADKARAEKAAADKAAAEQKQKELLAQKEKDKAEKLEKDKAARAEKEKEKQKAQAEKLAAAEKAAADKAAQAKAAAEKAKADKAAQAKADAASDQDKNAVLASLNSWARDWSEKDVRGYLAHYASDFETPKGASRKEWAEERRARIEDKGHISVKVSNAQISIKGNIATVRYRQIYNSNRLTVDSRKTLVFVKQGNRWLIKQERSGG